MNEMRVSTGLMNGVTSLFVPNLSLDHDNNVAVANGPTHKNSILCLPSLYMRELSVMYNCSWIIQGQALFQNVFQVVLG